MLMMFLRGTESNKYLIDRWCHSHFALAGRLWDNTRGGASVRVLFSLSSTLTTSPSDIVQTSRGLLSML